MDGLTECDILIIGGGPAGISAALQCLKNGKRVIMLNENPDVQPHGGADQIESIHPGVITLLERLEIDADISSAIRGRYTRIVNGENRMSLNPFEGDVWEGFHVSKSLFNAHLRKEAQKKGIVVMVDKAEDIFFDHERVSRVRTASGKMVSFKYVIDATGVRKFIGKRLAFREKLYSKGLVVWTGHSANAECNLFEKDSSHFIANPNGWTWLSKLSDNSFYWTRLSADRKPSLMPPAELKNAGSTQVNRVANMRWRIFRPLCTEGAILCGDAGSMLDPASGQGIFFAIVTGINAGETAVKCINNKNIESLQLAQYDQWYCSQFERNAGQLRDYYRDLGMSLR